MATWIFEPGHTEAEFRARHMMVTWVRGLFEDVRGTNGDLQFKADTELAIRGVTRTVRLDVSYLGQWATPWWAEGENRGSMRRAGFEATTRVNRHDFGVSWQDELPGGGVVVSNEIELTLDVEVLPLDDLGRTGAIEY